VERRTGQRREQPQVALNGEVKEDGRAKVRRQGESEGRCEICQFRPRPLPPPSNTNQLTQQYSEDREENHQPDDTALGGQFEIERMGVTALWLGYVFEA
jgi:hypothetical protein